MKCVMDSEILKPCTLTEFNTDKSDFITLKNGCTPDDQPGKTKEKSDGGSSLSSLYARRKPDALMYGPRSMDRKPPPSQMNRIVIITNDFRVCNHYSRNSLKIFLDIHKMPMYCMH